MKKEFTHSTSLPPSSRVVVALSGGVDSSCAAALLKEAGWEVYGLHFLIPSSPSISAVRERSARQAAKFLKISFEVLDVRDSFERLIIHPFAEAYIQGLTPNPCVRCNGLIKFHNLLQYAVNRDIPYVATGHYVRIRGDENDKELGLFKGMDTSKDQSYFLHRLRPEDLSRIVLPLGVLKKSHVRESARHMGLPAHALPESQEICFIPGNDYRQLIEERMGSGSSNGGKIVNADGTEIGKHSGVFRFTIGQRQGLGIASDRPFYVKEIRPLQNEIVAARRESLYSRKVEAEGFNWVIKNPPQEARVQAKIRYRHRAAPGTLKTRSTGLVSFTFDKPQWAVTPGQALVCYDGERLLGGGWIMREKTHTME